MKRIGCGKKNKKGKGKRFILWFGKTDMHDISRVGGKNASLGEMYKNLTKRGVRIPNGFSTTTEAYWHFLRSAGVAKDIKPMMKAIGKNKSTIPKNASMMRELITSAELPQDLADQIVKAYRKLCDEYGPNTDVAVRSSATAEDMPTASFAGQQETYLNIRGEKALLGSVKKCIASLFTNRAISYRMDKGINGAKVALSVGVQKMVRSDLASSGVMFTVDTETGFRDVVFINAAYGLGEFVVQGIVNPDEYYVFKPTLGKYAPIFNRNLGEKREKLVYNISSKSSAGKTKPTRKVSVPENERRRYVLSDSEILELARYAVIIEDHYSKQAGKWRPMDIEWAKDGKTGELFIVQARPETVQSQKSKNVLKIYRLKEKGRVLLKGDSVGDKIGAGTARLIMNPKKAKSFETGDVIVTDMTDPDWEPLMKRAAAIITERGGRTCFSGDTKILTNRGFMTMKEACDNYDGLFVPSLNKKNLKIEWKRIIASMKRKAELIEINTSLTGRMKGNYLRLTKDHKLPTYHNRELISKSIGDILDKHDGILIARNLPALNQSSDKEKNLAYLLGAIMTDGHIYRSRTHGEVQFIQKPTPEKENFIEHVKFCMNDIYNKPFITTIKKRSEGTIRGRPISGNANAYRCYSKAIAYEMYEQQQNVVNDLLIGDRELSLNFLAGVADGDGSISGSRINIYCSDENLLQSIIVACLRIGTVPQIATNRTIWNIQIVEKTDEITRFTKRIKYKSSRKNMGTKLVFARQTLGDIVDDVNYLGRIRPYVNKNLVIDVEKIRKNIIPLCKEKERQELESIVNSDTSMQRVGFSRHLGENDVYNITVEDNHNYTVFTDRYSPIIVDNCHAAIISRELGIPCVIGTNNATRVIKTGLPVTVDCSQGEQGYIYEGALGYGVKHVNVKKIPKTRTKVMMNVGMPESALEQASIPNSGVGLARQEFIITSSIRIHPLALIDYPRIPDKKVKSAIDKMTYGYSDKKQFFIDKLAEGIATISAAFYPNDVIMRFSDFKTNEYANLVGGKLYEPTESNPMIGWRGASRYYSDKFREAFELECEAVKKVRNVMGLKNLKVMVPFCRTVTEGKKVLAEMARNGLKRGRDGLEVYVMCEIPSNVILADQFAQIFDGFSIGSNDLTQLTLGLDRDSELISKIFDERNEAVKRLISDVIKVAKKHKRKIGICGQAPSTFPEFARFLVREGIDSISLNPDTVIATTLKIAEEERKTRRK